MVINQNDNYKNITIYVYDGDVHIIANVTIGCALDDDINYDDVDMINK